MDADFLIVGAGVSGAVLAERLAKDGFKVTIVEKRNHIGGNCFDYVKHRIIVQKYGPHIFHTKNMDVFKYLSQFTGWNDYKHKVVALHKGKYYPMPINRTTINRFYRVSLSTPEEAINFLKDKAVSLDRIENSRDVVVSKFGTELYEAFVRNYSKKQWGLFPEEMDRSVLERLPVRYDDNPYYFDDPYQGMPSRGFTPMFERMLKGIKVIKGKDFFAGRKKLLAEKIIYTGRLDQFFGYRFGRLDCRCMRFVLKELGMQSFQPNSVVNYSDPDVKFTRITEFRKFYETKTKGKKSANKTIICREYSGWKGEPSYPVLNETNRQKLERYMAEAKKPENRNVFFAGRLATHRYLNIDTAAEEALKLHRILRADNT
jgi:UDP-galactopyranose mutase